MSCLHILVLISATISFSLACSRVPQGTTAAKSPADDNFVVSIAGNPQTYIPGRMYNITLTAHNGLSFMSFILALETESNIGNIESMGSFKINDLSETRFSPRCANLIENTNTNAKTRIEVGWVAPVSTGNGCVFIRATVAQHRDVWYMDDGFLTKKICEEEIDDIDSQPSIMNPCCACDEAKYELTFERKWSRHTHPKDFPANSWLTRFSDIIGASHTIDYRFWQYGELASEGLREVAEHGSTRTLESELKDQSDQIRTIIKARGIAYPNVTGKTFAVFRVDSKHHLISLVSMIDPSPDWVVGVSGLELCLPNCSWVENKIHNLYPWDAGTDSGPSYMSADQPQVPPDVIRRIKSNFPNDPRSPFYDPMGVPMKPLATLHISRRRLYEKTCENTETQNDPIECATHAWSHWDDCSANCGPGKQYRTREFKNPVLAKRFKCRNALREEQNCIGHKCGGFNTEDSGGEADNNFPSVGSTNPECAVSEWGEWSSCSTTCGKGVSMQSRHYLNPRAKKKCQSIHRIKLQNTRPCEGIQCGGDLEYELNETGTKDEDNEMKFEGTKSLNRQSYRFPNFESYSQKLADYIPPECGVSLWSDFSPCNASCGGVGQRQRERKVWNRDEVYGVRSPSYDGTDPCRKVKRVEVVNCTRTECGSIVPLYCYEDLEVSPCRDSDVVNFWFYHHQSDQCALFWADKCDKNRNKFSSKEVCEETCRHPHQQLGFLAENLRLEQQSVDCIVSEWKAYACNATCGEGVQVKTRQVLRTPRNGGKPCPKHLMRIEKCYQRCDDMYSIGDISERRRGNYVQAKYTTKKDDCRYSEWSAWTPCTSSCGNNSVKQKTRTLLNTELSFKCKDRVRIEKCTPLPCLLDNTNDRDRWYND